MHFKMSSAICLNVDQSKILLSGNGLTLSQTRTGFACLLYKSFENTVGKGEIARKERLLKTLWEKEKCWSTFKQIADDILKCIQIGKYVPNRVETLGHICIVVCKCFQFGKSKELTLILYQTTTL